MLIVMILIVSIIIRELQEKIIIFTVLFFFKRVSCLSLWGAALRLAREFFDFFIERVCVLKKEEVENIKVILFNSIV